MTAKPEIECTKCGWQGNQLELLCSEMDMETDKDMEECEFNICPDCEAVGSFEDYEESE